MLQFVQKFLFMLESQPSFQPIAPFAVASRIANSSRNLVFPIHRTHLPGMAAIRRYPGLYVGVNLKRLIQSIVLAPRAPKWFGLLVRRIVNLAQLTPPVRKSTLENG